MSANIDRYTIFPLTTIVGFTAISRPNGFTLLQSTHVIAFLISSPLLLHKPSTKPGQTGLRTFRRIGSPYVPSLFLIDLLRAWTNWSLHYLAISCVFHNRILNSGVSHASSPFP